MASLSGGVASIAARKVIAAASAAGLACSISPSATPLSVVVSGVRFDSDTVNTAVILALAAGAAVRSPGAYPAAVADIELEELLFWDARTVAPLVEALVAFGQLQGAGAVAAWAALKRLQAEPQLDASAVDATIAAAFPHFVSLASSLELLEARLSGATPELYRGCSPDAEKAAAAVFGVEFDALRAVGYPLATAAPRLAAWLEARAWSAPWFAAAAGAAGAAAAPAPKAKAAKQAKAAAPAEPVAAAAPAAPAAATPASEPAAAGAAAAKPAKPAKAAGGKASKGGADNASNLLSAVTTEPLVPAGAAFDSASLRLPLIQALTSAFTAAIATAFPLAASKGIVTADVSIVTQDTFSHQYQCASPLLLGNKLKGTPGAPAGPRAAAEALLAAVTAAGLPVFVGRLEIAGPGYINIYLSASYLAARVKAVIAGGVLPPQLPAEGVRRVIVDYSSPNVAKEMHIGHLRSTIIGDAIARILEFCGHDVTRLNHVGDWGTQFGMLIAHLKDLQAKGAASDELDLSISDLTGFYKAAKLRFDSEPDFNVRAHKEVVALQAGDPVNLALWQRMVDISARMFNNVYSRLGVDPRLRLQGESFYNSRIPLVVGELQAAGVTETDGSAVIIRVPGQEVPIMLRKSDGGFGYDSTDLASLKYRLQELDADWLVYVVDSGQALHFQLVFDGARQAGWYGPRAPAGSRAQTARVEHVGFGVVQGEDGRKFKTRSGETVRLVDVLEEARDKARAILVERRTAGTTSLTSDAEIEHASAVLGYGGVKYFDLRQHRLNDYVFSYERMLASEGDTAVYLEYALVRVASILRKARDAGVDVDALLGDAAAPVVFTHGSEVMLAWELARFGEVVEDFTAALVPHKFAEFLFALSGRMTAFHRDCNVLGADTAPAVRDARLRLCAATLAVMRQAMLLLGLEPLERF